MTRGPAEGLGAAIVAQQAEAMKAEVHRLTELLATLQVCAECGALIPPDQTFTHDNWHADG